ncbi:MAG: 4-hydroxy-tetrahydrodipicolinate reductase [Lachnospiraceae bacterium]|nr:4-hydroxy-tetrahydrodipicolinate reductase [Lachnospiraceae bacterium]
MIRVIISGCSGHMGRMVASQAEKLAGVTIVAGIDPFTGPDHGFPTFKSHEECMGSGIEADVLIDFSSASALPGLLAYGREKKIPMVLCATGYTEEDRIQIEKASSEVAILRSANMTLGINLLVKLLKEAAPILQEAGFDIEIVEKHHNLKKDAPSGTALLLADAIRDSLPEKYDYVYDRSDRNEKRPVTEIGISAVRAGTIPGDHDVIFGGEDEVITFTHRAYSKAVFAKGALKAAMFLAGKGPGLYTMSDVIG